jgi:hypothetical protein
MTRASFLLIAALALAGCGGAPDAPGTADNAAGTAAPVGSAGGAAELAWTGRFAANADMCEGGVWTIAPARIRTDGELDCTVNRAERRGDLMALDLSCVGEGMESRERWGISPNADGGVRVSRAVPGEETIDVDLVRCG